MIGLEMLLKIENISFKELADRLGITKQNVSMWISGGRKIPKKYLPILCKMFNCSEDYIQNEVDFNSKPVIQNEKSQKEISMTEPKVGMTGLTFLIRRWSEKTKDISKQLDIDIETLIKWGKGVEPVPCEMLKQLASLYDIDKEYLTKDLYHSDYVTLTEFVFRKNIKDGKLKPKNTHLVKEVDENTINLLIKNINELNGEPIHMYGDLQVTKFKSYLKFLTSYVFAEGNERLLFIKDKFSINGSSFFTDDIYKIDIDKANGYKATIYFEKNTYIIISTSKQEIDFL